MIKAKFIVTHDGTGSYDRPDAKVSEYEKEFLDESELYRWLGRQNQHPWYTTHLVREVQP